MGALHAACLKSAADGPRAGRYTDFSGARRRFQKSAAKKAAKIFWSFFGAKSIFSGIFFFDLSGSEIFDIYKSGGCKFQRKLKSHGRKIWRLFFWNFASRGLKKNKKTTPYKNFQNFRIFCVFFFFFKVLFLLKSAFSVSLMG